MSVHWGGPGAGHVSRWSVATTGVPVLSLDFLTSNTLDPRITFTRSTTATFVGSNGLIQTAAINAPRFDYNPVTLAPNGLLIEEQRANLLTYSDQFNDISWTKATAVITANNLTSPDGTQNADSYIQTIGTTGEILRAANITVTANADFSISGFFKAVSTTPAVSLYATAGGNGFRVVANLSTGAVVSSGALGTGTFTAGSVRAFGNGWYLVSATGKLATGVTTGQWRAAMIDLALNPVVGNGAKGLGLWGAQLEQASFSTSYIPTVASTVTRAADIASMTGTNFSSWYNQSEGTIVVQAIAYGNKASSTLARIQDAAATTNYITARQSAGGTQILGQTSSSGGLTAGLAATNFTLGVPFKITVACAPSNSAVSVNGGSVGTSAAMTTMPVVDRLNISEGGPFYIRTLTYYPSRLSDAQLQALTA
jgi:hypothetical protein